jgi:uncharacterized protein
LGAFFINEYFMTLERINWKKNREKLEGSNLAEATPGRIKSIKKWFIFCFAIKILEYFLQKTRLFERGRRNAREIEVNLLEHTFDKLPSSFNGKCILHLSDLHLQERPEIINNICKLVDGHHVDFIVFTGDFTSKNIDNLSDEEIGALIKKIIMITKPKIGCFGVLGNHDHSSLVETLEKVGVRMLINEAVDINIGKESIRLIGTDDPHYYYTSEAKKILMSASEKFSIALVHTPELFDMAMFSGVDFYLCGHSHGGQVCLPFKIPILTHLNAGKRFFRGRWKLKNMVGYTSKGVGTVALPIRFNAVAEITFHYLRADNKVN